MATEMKLPQFGMGMSEAQIVKWLKAEGDMIEKGEQIVEIEAAKTTVEVGAPVAGRLKQIVAAAGETVPVYAVIALIEEEGGVTSSAGQAKDRPTAPEPPSRSRGAAVPAHERVSPRTRRFAARHGVDLATVTGTGRDGRIEEDDIVRAAQGITDTNGPDTIGHPAARAGPVEPLSAMRRVIARRMHESLLSSAQLTLVSTIDVSALVAFRARLKADYTVSVNDLLVRAAALALVRHPALNASIEGETIRRHDRIDIGIAVALEDGLMVPVLRNVDQLSLKGIGIETQRLAEAARVGRLRTEELSGSTFTVSNLGTYGIDAFTPIVNPPEAAILGVGRIQQDYCRTGVDSAAWRDRITLSLTIDHRLVDGAPGALFLQTVAELCGQPEQLG